MLVRKIRECLYLEYRSASFLQTFRNFVNTRPFTKAAEKNSKSPEELYSVEGDEDLNAIIEEKEAELERKRNKSMLWPQHYNLLHGMVPYNEAKNDIHLTLKYKKKMFGRYGYKSGVNPGALWPSLEEIEQRMEYEKVAYPRTITEMVDKVHTYEEKEKRCLEERQQKIIANLKKLDQWKKEIRDKAAKQAAQAAAAKAKKDALIEDVRRHFGFKIDPKDERFKEMLAQKERDHKKKLKEEKAKAKQERLLASLIQKEESS